jgi:hypothetical protein
MHFDLDLASTLKASTLIRSSPESPGCLDWSFIHHDDNSGMA